MYGSQEPPRPCPPQERADLVGPGGPEGQTLCEQPRDGSLRRIGPAAAERCPRAGGTGTSGNRREVSVRPFPSQLSGSVSSLRLPEVPYEAAQPVQSLSGRKRLWFVLCFAPWLQ